MYWNERTNCWRDSSGKVLMTAKEYFDAELTSPKKTNFETLRKKWIPLPLGKVKTFVERSVSKGVVIASYYK